VNNKTKIWIFVASFLGLALIYFTLFYEKDKRYDWSEDYVLDKEKPYGTWLISELLKEYQNHDYHELNKPLDRSLNNAEKGSNYIFIGEEIYLEKSGRDSLLSFVAKGNSAFIFTITEPLLLLQELIPELDVDSFYTFYEYAYSDSLLSKLVLPPFHEDKAIRIPYRYRKDLSAYHWAYLSPNIKDERIVFLGRSFGESTDNKAFEGVNYFSIAYGDGIFYFHTQPISFSNIVLKESDMLGYSNRVFAYLDDGPILWEEHNWRFNKPNNKTWLYKPDFFKSGKGPLNFILSNPPLKWAWYLALLFTFLFVIFNGKRRKAIVPVLPDRTNTSLRHLKNVSKLYNMQDEHYVICVKMFENFLAYLQNEFRIDTEADPEKIMSEIAAKSNIDPEIVKKIFKRYKYIEFSKTARLEIFKKFNQELNAFYEQIKK
jgi:hypothetical protein